MTPRYRGQVLQRFDSLDPSTREDMLLAGRATAYRYKLSSQYLYHVLWRILDRYKYRYSAPSGDPEEDQEVQRIKDEIEKHGWLENALKEASGNKKWEAILDRSVDQEIRLENSESARHRKSHYTEYRMIFQRRMEQLNEQGPVPMEDDSDDAV
jgi:hypothetical protein